MKLLLHLDQARVPSGGGYIAMRRLARSLRERGIEVTETATHRLKAEGKALAKQHEALDLKGIDALLTSASVNTRITRRAASEAGIPVVAFVHSALSIDPRLEADLVVWGSWALRAYGYNVDIGIDGEWADHIMYPLIFPDEVRVRERLDERITLINLSREKGGDIFYRTAERCPDLPFLGVRGWGEQIKRPPLPNLEIIPWISDPRNIYERTKILLFMKGESCGEGWLRGVGLTALEAAVSGIPTIAYPGEGLTESLGGSAAWCNTLDPAHWSICIRLVLSEYDNWSRLARAKGDSIDPEKSTTEFLAALWSVLR